MLELEVFILELLAIDGFSTGAVTVGEVSTLDHKVFDHAVES